MFVYFGPGTRAVKASRLQTSAPVLETIPKCLRVKAANVGVIITPMIGGDQ